jgi:hypothetical protein
VNRADGISEIEGKGRRGDRASWAGSEFQIRVSKESPKKNLDSDDHFDRSFSFMAMKGKSRTQPQQQLEPKNYENSMCSKTNSPLALVAGASSHRTGAGYHRRVDSGAGPRHARMRP